MARLYLINFENVSVAAVQDLFSFKGSTGKTCKLKKVVFGPTDTSLQTAQSLRLRVRYHSATITLGSGGASATPVPVDPGDSAASFTAHTNDTSQATTSGTATAFYSTGVHNYTGWSETFDQAFGLNEGVTVELLSTVSGTCHFSGTAYVEETGS